MTHLKETQWTHEWGPIVPAPDTNNPGRYLWPRFAGATQGHYIKELDDTRMFPTIPASEWFLVPTMVHGTSGECVFNIMEHGMVPAGNSAFQTKVGAIKNRNDNHLAPFPAHDPRCKAGMRSGCVFQVFSTSRWSFTTAMSS